MRLRTYAKTLTKENGMDGLLVLAFLAATMLSIYTAIAAMICIIIYTIVEARVFTILNSIPGTIYIIIFCLLAFVVSAEYQNNAGIFIAIAFAAIMYIGMFMRQAMTPALLEKGIDLCCVMSWVCFGVAMLQRIIMGEGSRQDATFMNANYYAMVIEFVVIFCMYKLFQTKDLKKILMYAITIAVNAFGLFLCDCRSSFVVLAVMLPIMLLLNKKYKLFAITMGVFALCALSIFVVPELFPRYDAIPKDLAKRMSIWKTALRGIADSPIFGRGGNAYAGIYNMFGGHKTVHAHNILFDFLLNYGVVGTTLVFAYLFKTSKSIYRVFKQPENKAIGVLAIMVCIGVIVHGLTDITVIGLQTAPLFLFVMSVAGLDRTQESEGLAMLPLGRTAIKTPIQNKDRLY